MHKPVSLQIKNLCVERGERLLCHDLSFSVQGGDLVRIVGENGAGKSSLIKAILGWITIEDGSVEFNGEDVTSHREMLLSKQLYIGHLTGIKDVFTAAENLSLYCPDATSLEISAALDKVNLAHYEDTPASQLSAGQKRRVALARLWLTDKAIWFLDEPFTALDVSGVETLEQRIAEHLSIGGAVVMTTHQPLIHLNPKVVELGL